MHGFIAVITQDQQISKPTINWKPLFDFQNQHIKRRYGNSSMLVEQFTSEKFLSEKLWIDTDDFFIVTEGVITNLDQLCKKHHAQNYNELIQTIHIQANFFEDFRGNFVGILWNKKDNSAIAFNNHAGSKRLFYYKNESVTLFSTDLYTLSKCMDSFGIPKSLDTDAAYLLLSSGYMHENYTLIKEVKQLRAGEFICSTLNELNCKSYFNLKDIKETNDSPEEIIANLENLFKESLKLEYDCDNKANLTSLTTLSGGLDSRTTTFIAHELGYCNQKLINYCENGYADQIISKQIAEKYKLDIQQISLSPDGLCSIDEIVAVNDGLAISLGAGQVFDAVSRNSTENIGLIHTGITGDSVMGSTVSSLKQVQPNINMCLYSKSLLDKAQPILAKNILNYKNEELYKFYNPILMGETNGFLFLDLIGECTSAFLNPDFLSYAYSMPRKYRYNKKAYLQWVLTLHPQIKDFIWENMGGKPTTNKFLKFYYRYKRAVVKRLPVHSMWKNTMNPEQFWYDTNQSVRTYFDNYYNNHIELLAHEPELQKDLSSLFDGGTVNEKSQVLTLLGAYKLLF